MFGSTVDLDRVILSWVYLGFYLSFFLSLSIFIKKFWAFRMGPQRKGTSFKVGRKISELIGKSTSAADLSRFCRNAILTQL